MPRLAAEVARVDAPVDLGARVRTGNTTGIGGVTLANIERVAYVKSIRLRVSLFICSLVVVYGLLLVNGCSATFVFLRELWSEHVRGKRGHRKRLAVGGDGMVFSSHGDRGAPLKIIFHTFDAVDDLVSLPDEVSCNQRFARSLLTVIHKR